MNHCFVLDPNFARHFSPSKIILTAKNGNLTNGAPELFFEKFSWNKPTGGKTTTLKTKWLKIMINHHKFICARNL